jgi:hypothetical protein
LFRYNFGFALIAEDFHPQTFISKFSVETFTFPVLPRAARFDIRRLDVFLCQKLLDDSGDKFRAVVRSEKFGIAAPFSDRP